MADYHRPLNHGKLASSGCISCYSLFFGRKITKYSSCRRKMQKIFPSRILDFCIFSQILLPELFSKILHQHFSLLLLECIWFLASYPLTVLVRGFPDLQARTLVPTCTSLFSKILSSLLQWQKILSHSIQNITSHFHFDFLTERISKSEIQLSELFSTKSTKS